MAAVAKMLPAEIMGNKTEVGIRVERTITKRFVTPFATPQQRANRLYLLKRSAVFCFSKIRETMHIIMVPSEYTVNINSDL